MSSAGRCLDNVGERSDDQRRSSDHSSRWIWLSLALLLLSTGVYYVAVKGEGRSAFERWRPEVDGLFAGENIYAGNPFPTPPIMAVMLRPFTLLPGGWGMAAWFALKSVLALFCLWVLIQWSTKDEPVGAAALAAAMLLSVRPILGDLLHGNVNLVVLSLVVASVLCFRAKADELAGLFLAWGIACKLTPALLLVYFIYKRSTNVVVWTFLGLLLWLVVVPGLFLGQQRNLSLLSTWGERMVMPFLRDGVVETEQINQSVPALVHRLTTPSLAIKPDDGRPPISINIVSLTTSQARLLTMASVAVLLGWLAWACRAPIERRDDPRWRHEIALTLLMTLLVSERTWKHHYTLAVPSLVLLTISASQALRREKGKGLGWWLSALLGLSALAMSTTSKDLMKPLLGVDGSKLAQAYGVYLWASVCLLIGHGMCLKRSSAAATGARHEPSHAAPNELASRENWFKNPLGPPYAPIPSPGGRGIGGERIENRTLADGVDDAR